MDLDYFKAQEDKSKDISIIFTGQMDYLPNIDAVTYFYGDIFPLITKKVPNVSFCVVGRNPPPRVKGICKKGIITGEVEDIRDYLHKAKVYIAPMRISHGVQNKILEAMAIGLPVVATSKVLQGMSAIKGVEIMIGDTPEEFAACVVELLKDETKRGFIAKNARVYVERCHNWNINLKPMDDIFKKVIPS